MIKISLHDAQTNLSSLVKHVAQGKSAVITTEGQPRAVIIGFEEWIRLQSANSFGRLLALSGLEDDDISARNPGPLETIEY